MLFIHPRTALRIADKEHGLLRQKVPRRPPASLHLPRAELSARVWDPGMSDVLGNSRSMESPNVCADSTIISRLDASPLPVNPGVFRTKTQTALSAREVRA